MYVPIVLLGFVALVVGGHFFLSWLLVETSEDRETEGGHARPPRSFYNPRTWAAFRRLTAKRPALLMYRRDKKGRFRKLAPGVAAPVRRSVKRRKSAPSRRTSARRKAQIPAE